MHLKCAKIQSSSEASINYKNLLLKAQTSTTSCRVIYWLAPATALYRAKFNNCLIAGPHPAFFFNHYCK